MAEDQSSALSFSSVELKPVQIEKHSKCQGVSSDKLLRGEKRQVKMRYRKRLAYENFTWLNCSEMEYSKAGVVNY